MLNQFMFCCMAHQFLLTRGMQNNVMSRNIEIETLSILPCNIPGCMVVDHQQPSETSNVN